MGAGMAVEALRAADPELGVLIDRIGPLRLMVQPLHSPFLALAESIVYQQVTGKAATTIYRRLCGIFPRHKITPTGLSTVSIPRLRRVGLSRTKALALKDLALRRLDRTVPPLKKMAQMTDDEIIAHLCQVRGVGRWTVEMMLIFRLGRPDVLPSTDYAIRKGFALAFATPFLPSPKQVLARGEQWRPYRSIASWYLWRATETAPA